MLTLAKNSLAFEVKGRQYGLQDKGVSPKGASDQLSFELAKTLLGNPQSFICFEIIFSTEIYFDRDCVFTLTGAHYKEIFLHENKEKTSIEHSGIYKAKKGSFLSFHQLQKGFRLYLMASSEEKTFKRVGIRRGDFTKYFSKNPNYIRLIKGPEFHYLQNSKSFLESSFQISKDSNLIGLRLEGQDIEATSYDIISTYVNDGTIQLTKDGPIILLRHRQTTGGYPRIFSVISADIDTLSQYPICANIHFKLVEINEAKELLLQKEEELLNFKNIFLNL